MCKNHAASIKGALLIWLRNFVFRFSRVEGSQQKSKASLINERFRSYRTYMPNLVSLAPIVYLGDIKREIYGQTDMTISTRLMMLIKKMPVTHICTNKTDAFVLF